MYIRSEVEGKIIIFLESLSPDIDLQNYIRLAKEDDLNLDNSNVTRYLTYYLKKAKKRYGYYPSLSIDDIRDDMFFANYRERFNRIQSLLADMYFYSVEHSTSSIQDIIKHAEQNNITRVLIFSTIDLVADYLELLKIFKLNSFLSYREMNSSLSPELYSKYGFIRNKRIGNIFQGKGKGIGRYTFEAFELLLDKEIGSNLTYINKAAY